MATSAAVTTACAKCGRQIFTTGSQAEMEQINGVRRVVCSGFMRSSCATKSRRLGKTIPADAGGDDE